MEIQIQLVFILLAVPTILSEINYCALKSCPNRTHTLCKYPRYDTDKSCGSPVHLALSIKEKFEIYDYHINLKQKSEIHRRQGLGLDPNTYRVKKRKYYLDWDNDLTRMAQRWANQCPDKIDQCRNTDEFSVDQRIAVTEFVNDTYRPSFGEIIQTWYNAGPYTTFNRRALQTSRNARSMWESATKIGCGAVRTYNDTQVKVFLVCNYAPVEYNVTIKT